MSSKLAALRERSTRTLLTAFDSHDVLLARQFSLMFHADPLSESSLSEAKSRLSHLKQQLENACQAMLEADRMHVVALSDDTLHRKRRDENSKQLIKVMRNIRSTLDATYGKAFANTVVPSRLSNFNIHEALSFGRTLHEKLLQAEQWTLPAEHQHSSYISHLAIDKARTTLGTHLEALEASLRQVEREKREAESNMVRRDRAVKTYEDIFFFAARHLELLLNMAGETKLAERVRPSPRRIGVTDKVTSLEGKEPTKALSYTDS